jgi:ribosomal protein S18 acetylase RimI-like enzyme
MAAVLRVADPRDAPEVTAIYVESSNEGFGSLFPARHYTPERVAQWEKTLALGPPYRWWVAEIDTTIVGFIGIGPSRDPVDPTIGEVDTIAVDTNHSRTGIGRALMTVAVKHLTMDGYRDAILWTRADYERGRTFYEATGWTLDGGTRDDSRQVRYRRQLHRP